LKPALTVANLPSATLRVVGPSRECAGETVMGRIKRLSFMAGLIFLLYVATEILVFSAAALYDQRLSWIASNQDRRERLQVELAERPGLILQIHPYVGYVETPPRTVGGDSGGRPHPYSVTPYGYADTVSPIQTRSPGKLIVAVTGGSVAWSFHMHGTRRLKALLQRDPALARKEIVFVNLAVSGYKQPQQLMTLNYMLVLGAQFDIVINIDGFNEAALYEAENAARHVFPAFPRSWQNRVEVSGPRVSKYLGPIENLTEHRLHLARGFSRLPWKYSPLCNLVWSIADGLSETRIRALEVEYGESTTPASNYVVEGPGWKFATREDLYRHIVALWKNSSIQLDNLCTSNGIRYYHFLQPNLLVPGAKPLTAAEQHMAAHRDNMYRPGVESAYPRMIDEGRALKARGERFTDLTQMFAGHPEGVYVDICHFNQAGNDLLADRVAEAILGRDPSSSAPR
jgi:hypothetical protein